MNTNPSSPRSQLDLVGLASNPHTDQEVLRTLAFEYAHLRPIIALNPSAYDGLLAWLGDLGDEKINAALHQRQSSGPVYPDVSADNSAEPVSPAVDPALAGAPATPVSDGVSVEPTTSPDIVETAAMSATVAQSGEDDGEDDPASAPATTPEQAATEAETTVLPSAATASAGTLGATTASAASEVGEKHPGQVERRSLQRTEPLSAVPASFAPVAYQSAPVAASNAPAGYSAGSGFGGNGYGSGSGGNGYGSGSGGSGYGSGSGGRGSGSGRGSKKNTQNIIIAVLAVVALVLTGLVIYFAMRSPEDPQDQSSQVAPTSEASSETMQPEDTDAEDETEPESDDGEKLYKPPAGTEEISHITSPSGNIVCELLEDEVTCTVHETFEQDEATGRVCDGDFITVTGSEEEVVLDCAHKVSAQGAKAKDFGSFAQRGNMACASQHDGVSCWNQISGIGFGVARQGWVADYVGFIKEDQYPWHR